MQPGEVRGRVRAEYQGVADMGVFKQTHDQVQNLGSGQFFTIRQSREMGGEDLAARAGTDRDVRASLAQRFRRRGGGGAISARAAAKSRTSDPR